MSSPASGTLRVLRVAIVTVAGTMLAVAAHAAAGGDLPEPGAVVSASVIPALAGLWLSGRRRGWPSIAAVLSAVQVVVHGWLMSAAAAEACSGGGGHVAHHAAAVVRCSSVPGMPGILGTHGMHGGSLRAGPVADWPLAEGSGAMVMAHAVAVALTALVLAAGERAVWQLVQWLRPALRLLRVTVAVVSRRPAVPVLAAVPVLRLSPADLSGPGRRGPPARR